MLRFYYETNWIRLHPVHLGFTGDDNVIIYDIILWIVSSVFGKRTRNKDCKDAVEKAADGKIFPIRRFFVGVMGINYRLERTTRTTRWFRHTAAKPGNRVGPLSGLERQFHAQD